MVVRMTPEEYDLIYLERPERWTDAKRDEFAFKCLSDALHEEPYKLLDLGCGNGHTLAFFADRWKKTKYHGIDLSKIAIKLAKAKVPQAELYAARLDDFDPYNYYEHFGPFNCILIMGVAEHFADIVKELKIVRDNLTKNGCVYLEVPNVLRLSGRPDEGWYESSHQYEWHLRRETWEKHILDAGFYMDERIVGPSVFCEFVWILKKKEKG